MVVEGGLDGIAGSTRSLFSGGGDGGNFSDWGDHPLFSCAIVLSNATGGGGGGDHPASGTFSFTPTGVGGGGGGGDRSSPLS